MMSIHNHFFAGFNSHPPATTVGIEHLRNNIAFSLPEDYQQFLLHANGGEGFIGANAYLILWRIEELVTLNKSYEVEKYASGFFLFGSDGGGEAFAFDARGSTPSIVAIPFIGMDPNVARQCAASFDDFIEYLYRS